MQTKKHDLRVKIIETSRNEFFEKGFKNSSMRSISQKSNVGLSNIYNYFANKDEILSEILTPLLTELTLLLENHNEPNHIDIDVFYSTHFKDESSKLYLRLVTKYKQELKLLLFQSHGSTYENFRDDFVRLQGKIGKSYMDKMKEKYPEINIAVSSFFLHNICSWFVNILGEIVTHDLTEKEILQFFHDYVEYSTAGWKQLMKVGNSKLISK
ncbi:TetR/AcrR family transcriptional regulator [Halosquirtibacter xylanolyticus]|uniref:TetR/AcrR family transcriptional regulator n=1 Tax=Halosquirtibacter xylanolyticus TaxID=3374599 RepID=UPI0037485577|nr:TetR/AcrR family transcriptional regulator [Prolixibacteraceae bacterium]